jgi:hypothetical protein
MHDFLANLDATGYPPAHADPSLRSCASAASLRIFLCRGVFLPLSAGSRRRHPEIPHRDAWAGATRAVPSRRRPAPTSPEDVPGLKIRPLLVDGRQKEWTTGDAHDVTDRSFTVRRALRLNDSLPGDAAAHWIWQPGPWLLVDRTTGRATALHLPEFDPIVSQIVWFRDYAAYCGIATTAKGGLLAIVAQIGQGRRSCRSSSRPGHRQSARRPSASPRSGSASLCA